jgi:hypothetical protein
MKYKMLPFNTNGISNVQLYDYNLGILLKNGNLKPWKWGACQIQDHSEVLWELLQKYGTKRCSSQACIVRDITRPVYADGGGHFCCQQPCLWMCKHAELWQRLRLGSWINMEVWGAICVPTQGETLTQIYRELVLSLCTGNKFPCRARHSKMAEMTWLTKAVRPSTLTWNDNMSLRQAWKYTKLQPNSTSHQKCRKLFMTLLVTGK